MFDSLTSPAIIAHRGASSHAPENTLSAFLLAVEQGADAIELDVQLTKDNQVVVFHDTHLNRTTDGSGLIKDLTYSEISELNAGISFDPAYQGEKIPILSTVFARLPSDVILNIELKNLHDPYDDLPARTGKIIQEFKAEKRVLISSFNSIALSKFHKLFPSIPRGKLIHSSYKVNLFCSFNWFLKDLQSVHISYKTLTPQIISSFQKMGKFVYSYTLNHTQDIITAVKMGIDGFFTDDPAFARRILIQHGVVK